MTISTGENVDSYIPNKLQAVSDICGAAYHLWLICEFFFDCFFEMSLGGRHRVQMVSQRGMHPVVPNTVFKVNT